MNLTLKIIKTLSITNFLYINIYKIGLVNIYRMYAKKKKQKSYFILTLISW